jgi:hypothetical protein
MVSGVSEAFGRLLSILAQSRLDTRDKSVALSGNIEHIGEAVQARDWCADNGFTGGEVVV